MTKKAKTIAKKGPKIKNEDAEAGSENDGPVNKMTKAAMKKGKKANDDEADGDFEQGVQPVRKGRKQTKKATNGEEAGLQVKDESSDHDAIPPPAVKKTRAPRKAAAAKKLKDEDNETDDLDTPLNNVKLEHTSEPEAEASEGTPKLQKRGKKAIKKAVNGNGMAAEASKEVKPKVRLLLP